MKIITTGRWRQWTLLLTMKKYYYFAGIAVVFTLFIIYEVTMFSLDSNKDYLLQTQSATTRAFDRTTEKATQNATENEKQQTMAVAQTDSTYYLILTEGRVCIYRGEEHVFYDYAVVNLDIMPEDIKQQLQYGLYLSNEQELYDFLQTYSS